MDEPVVAFTLEDLSYDYTKGNTLLRRQLSKEILSNTGVWADVAFLHQDNDLAGYGWKPAKITVARFKRINGVWKKQSHFNINSIERAEKLITTLLQWRDKIGESNV